MNSVFAPNIPPDLEWLGPGPARGLQERRGRVVLLDFWNRSCVNCAHVAVDLARYREVFGTAIEIIGVHSPKFPTEREPDVVRAGIEQLGVHHPVVNDPDLRVARLFGVQEWPTVIVIDAQGRFVVSAVGEDEVAALEPRLAELVDESPSEAADADPGLVSRSPLEARTLRHPHRLLATEFGLLVSEQQGDVVLLDDGGRPRHRWAGFTDPVGLGRLPDGRVAVADAGRHLVVAFDPVTHGQIDTGRAAETSDSWCRRTWPTLDLLVGTGHRGRRRLTVGRADSDIADRPKASDVDLASPHDVLWWQGQLVVAVAGLHQLAFFDAIGPTSRLAAVVGTSAEGLKDGPARRSRLATPTALSAGADRLWFVDTDSSALRWFRKGQVGTAIGHSVQVSGHRDGPGGKALLQHPGGLAIDSMGRVLIADIFNGAVRRYDPSDETIETVASGLAEPTDVIADRVFGDWALGDRALADRALGDGALADVLVAQRCRPSIDSVTLEPRTVQGASTAFELPPTVVAPTTELRFAGSGEVEMTVAAEPSSLVASCEPTRFGLTITFGRAVVGGTLHIEAARSHCDATCSILNPSWLIDVVISIDGQAVIPLIGR